MYFSFVVGAKPTSNTGVRVRSHDNHDGHPSASDENIDTLAIGCNNDTLVYTL